ncbi:molybdate ABC transporter permease subunit [uncultured Paracoccus sp.]|uniref:molybdate ABC transporter permease subunit n=1 Tax=uncultured Paracoccus sp. TaxID=189685 RepID=UPI00261703C5|nr:molybdate ABC transporter permease subunit [uncultured Paracoccus sp.]
MSWLGPEEWQAVALSLRVATVASLFGLPLAIGMAWLLARKRFPGHGLLSAATHLPLVLPPVVTGHLLLMTFSRNAPLGGFLDRIGMSPAFHWTGAAIAAGVMAFPLMVRAIRLGFEAVDPRLEQTALTLGAGRLSVFWTVTLPLILPGIIAGGALGFAKAMGEFGATITFVANIPGQTQTLPLAIFSLLQVPGGETAASRLVLMSILIAVGAVIISEILARRAQARLLA